jgi:acetylornithine/succinyldiaminopimelate/putrescine aminotransferase/predicted amino acid dehydrogenase/acyl-CoA synthetase (AMP-forming)/AMP-acid ligase II
MAGNSNIIDSNREDFFDIIIESKSLNNDTGLQNLAGLLFNELPWRNENSNIIISHVKEESVSLTLRELRIIVGKLYQKLHAFGIQKGNSVYLASLECNSEIYIAILFLALSSYGVKVFLPMYLEKELVEGWYSQFKFDFIIIPGNEIEELKHHQRQKNNIAHLKNFAQKVNIKCLDIFSDLELDDLVSNPPLRNDPYEKKLIEHTIRITSETDEALMITTSGTSGISKIVVYNHRSILLNISGWRKAGLYHPDKLGGRGFTPLFTHTMGIRYFINALWLGNSVILINTEWIIDKPEIVRYFLIQSEPEHITGGAAIFNILIEMCRIFPDLKKTLRNSLKTIVSSGTAIQTNIIRKMNKTFNLNVHNALGTTETQQVLNTVIKNKVLRQNEKSLGSVIPGATIGLKKYPKTSDTFKLFIKSQFGGIRIIDEHGVTNIQDKFIYLGDLVVFNEKELSYLKREQADYINDAFGVKIPLNSIRENYKKIFESFYHTEIIPLKFKPGLGAMIFIDNSSDLKDKKLISEIHSIIEKSNNEMYDYLEPLEFNHRVIKRFSCISSKEIANRKGIISDYKIKKNHSQIIKNLTESNQPRSNISEIRSIAEKANSFSMYHNPYIGKLLACLEMDVSYHSAQDDFLYYKQINKKNKIIDFTGGYGTNLLGHHHEKLIKHAIQFLESNRIPLSDQFSLQKYPGLLAEKLGRMISLTTHKSYYTLFGSSGSEVVEISIHHAYLEWINRIRKMEHEQKTKYSYKNEVLFKNIWNENWSKINQIIPVLIANKNAFHGHSSGARSILGDNERRKKFGGIINLNTVFINDLDPDYREQIECSIESNRIVINLLISENNIVKIIPFELSTVIAAIVEPILGEGGIREINEGFPKALASFDFPLIIDEIQSGLGRAGSFLASRNYVGNYYLFSKALGGNITKISAISIEKERFIKKIGKLYVSTFSGGGFAAKIALENLKLIEQERIAEKAKKAGDEIVRKLKVIQNKHTDVINSIQGKGLMIGIKFARHALYKNLFLRVLDERKLIGYLFSSYLLKNHNLRILPSISAPDTLRVEPSVCISSKSIDVLCDGIDRLASFIKNENFYEIVKHLMSGDPYIDNKGKIPDYGYLYTKIDIPTKNAIKVAFVAHFAYPVEEMRMISNDLIKASDTGIRQLFSKFEIMMDMKPFILNAKSLYNGKIHLYTILLPLDSSELEKLHKTVKRNKVVKNIQIGVDMAARQGCQYISLGGYNSIISKNGEEILAPENAKVVTGNTLTAVVGYYQFIQKVKKLFKGNRNISIGIVGAHGNIGNILALRMITDSSIHFKDLWLIGKNNTKLNSLKRAILKKNKQKNRKIYKSLNLGNLKKCDAFIVAVNSNDPIIYPEHIKKNKSILIADLSIPTALSDDILHNKNIHKLPNGASIKLTNDADFLATSCSPKGTALCCIAEALLLAFEPLPLDFRGKISLEGFDMVYNLAKKKKFIYNTDKLRSFKTEASDGFSL